MRLSTQKDAKRRILCYHFAIISETATQKDASFIGIREMSALSRNIFNYVEIFYNRKRLYSTLGYMSPVVYRLQHQQANIA